MTRRRRLAVIAATVLASFAGSAVAAHADLDAPPVTTQSGGQNTHGDWVCVHVETVMLTYCQGDPLPEHLPLPDKPRL